MTSPLANKTPKGMDNIHIEGSSRMSRAMFLFELAKHEGSLVMLKRSKKSLLREWAAHKLLFTLGILPSHTESVDLNYPQAWYIRLGYFVLGGIALLAY